MLQSWPWMGLLGGNCSSGLFGRTPVLVEQVSFDNRPLYV